MARILVVDGAAKVSGVIGAGLRSRGWIVDITDHGPTAVALAVTGRYRMVILDMELRDQGGLRLLREIVAVRADQKVIALCGRAGPESGILALEQGATDYLARPFTVDEVVARVGARTQESSGRYPGLYLHSSGMTVDLARRTVDTGRGEVRLTQREFVLLVHLVSSEGRVFSRRELLSVVWGAGIDPDSNVVDVCVRRLRTKLGDDVIETVRNVGYALRTP